MLRRRLQRVFSVVTFAALAGVALAAVRAIEVSHRAATAAARADLEALEDAHQLQGLLYQKGFVAEYFLTGDSRWMDELHRATPAFEAWLTDVTKEAHTDDAARAAAQLAAEYGRYDAGRNRAVMVFDHGDHGAAVQMLIENTDSAAKLRELAESLIKLRREDVQARLAEGERVWRHAVWWLCFAVLVAMLGAAAIGYALARQAQRVTQLSNRLTQAEKMSALGEMATAVAHEVLNPLTGVKTALQLLGRSNRSPDVVETVDAVDAEIRRVEGLARRLVSFSRPLSPQKQPCNVSDVFERVARAARVEAEAHSVELEARPSDVKLEADPDLLVQVLVNLTVNACQAMPSGGRVQLGARRDSGWLVLEVRDEGDGLPREVAERLFTPFVTTKAEGHGLGLAISQNIALAHGGRLEARTNAPERGTTFSLWLPEAAA
jgi:signal transduction histidine kinase